MFLKNIINTKIGLKVEFRGMELTIQEYNGENPKDEEDAWNRYMEKHSKDATKKYKVEPLVRPEGQSFMVRGEFQYFLLLRSPDQLANIVRS